MRAAFLGGGTAPGGGPEPLTLRRAVFPNSKWFIATGLGAEGPKGWRAHAANRRK